MWQCYERASGRCCALKKVVDAFRNVTDAERSYREVVLLHALNLASASTAATGGSGQPHPNIVRLLNVMRSSDDRHLYLIFDYMDVSLLTLLKSNALTVPQQRHVLYQLLCALKFVHSAEVVHRDVKPSNVLVNANCQAKLVSCRSCAYVQRETAEECNSHSDSSVNADSVSSHCLYVCTV